MRNPFWRRGTNGTLFSDFEQLSKVVLQRLDGDSLVITLSGDSLRIPVDSILVIRTMKRYGILKGAAIGMVVGAAAGVLLGGKSYGRLIFSSAGFGLGGLIGAGLGRNEIYDFSHQHLEQKLRIIDYLLSKYDKK